MKLYTKTYPTNLGIVRKKIAWQFDFRVQLTDEEVALVRHYEYWDFTVGKAHEDTQSPIYVELRRAAAGIKGWCFEGIGPLTRFEASLIEGCQRLCVTLQEFRRIHRSPESWYNITAEGAEPLSYSKSAETNTNPRPAEPGDVPPILQPPAPF